MSDPPEEQSPPKPTDDASPDTERPPARERASLDMDVDLDVTGADASPDVPTERKLQTHTLEYADVEATVNLTGDMFFPPPREDLPESEGFDEDDTGDGSTDAFRTDPPTALDGANADEKLLDLGAPVASREPFGDAPESVITQVYPLPPRDGAEAEALAAGEAARAHLKGLLEALVFVTERPAKAADLAKSAGVPLKDVRDMLGVLRDEYAPRGIQLDEVAGGWIFRTSPVYASFVRGVSQMRPVKLTRAQIETLAILAYRQPITRPEIDEIRGVDSGPVLKLLLDRDLIRILGKKDEPGRPLLYGTTQVFLEFFGLKALRDMPTLREYTELNEDSRRVVERELGDVLDERQEGAAPAEAGGAGGEPNPTGDDAEESAEGHDTMAPAEPQAERANFDELFGSSGADGDADAANNEAPSEMRAVAASQPDAEDADTSTDDVGHGAEESDEGEDGSLDEADTNEDGSR